MRADRKRWLREVEPPQAVDGRPPPHDLDAEAAVLSAVMVDGTGRVLDEVLDFLKADQFYAEAHRRIFEAALSLHAEGQPTDIVTIMTRVKDRGRLEQVGGPGYLTQIINASPALANVEAHARIVHAKAKAQSVILAAQRIVSLGYSDYGTAKDYAAESAEALHAIAHDETTTTMSHVKDVLSDVARDLVARGNSGQRMAGKSTGFARYDRLTSGLHDGDLTIVAARPGMGKTSAVLQWAVSVAKGDPAENVPSQGVAFFSLEMPKRQLGGRIVCAQGGIDVSKLRSGALTPFDFQKLIAAATDVGKNPIWIDDQPGVSVLEIRARCRRIQSEIERGGTPAKRLGLVAIDYLQLMKGDGSSDSREQEVSGITRALKGLAKELGVPVVALSQLNRKLEERGDKRPLMSDLRESGAIEQDADNICFIFRDDYYTKEKSKEPGVAEMILEKQRNGPTGVAKMRWDGECTRFEDLPEGSSE